MVGARPIRYTKIGTVNIAPPLPVSPNERPIRIAAKYPSISIGSLLNVNVLQNYTVMHAGSVILVIQVNFIVGKEEHFKQLHSLSNNFQMVTSEFSGKGIVVLWAVQ